MTEETELSKRYSIDFTSAKVQVFEFKEGYEIPRHAHSGEALHIITRGKIQLDNGDIIEGLANYSCGGWEYRGTVLKDTTIIVIEK